MIATVHLPRALERALDDHVSMLDLHEYGAMLDRRIATEALALSDSERFALLHTLDPRGLADV